MPYQILVPTSDVSIDEGLETTEADYHSAVDDGETHDGTTTEIYAKGGVGGYWQNPFYANFGMSNPSRIGVITSVELHVVMWKSASDINGYGVIGIDGDGSYYLDLTTSWVDYTLSWNTNPATGLAWTWGDLDSIEPYVGLSTDNGMTYKYAEATSLYLKVNHTQPAGGGGAQIIGLESW